MDWKEPAGPERWRFYDPHGDRRLAWSEVLRRLLAARVVLVGEEHDASLHPALQGRLLAQWVQADVGSPAVAAFEHFDREFSDELERLGAVRPHGGLTGSPEEDPGAGLRERLAAGHFDERAWQWPQHRPLFERLVNAPATWMAANLSRDAIRRRTGQAGGRPSADDAAIDETMAAASWDADAQRSLAQAIQAGHCGMLGDAALERTVLAQRWRDAAMAVSLRRVGVRRVALVAGNGHVRRDHGVPRYLGERGQSAQVVGFEQIAMTQWAHRQDVAGSEGSLTDLVGRDDRERMRAAYDVVCMTLQDPGSERVDPCAGIHGDATKRQSISADANSEALNASRSSGPSPTPMK